MSVKTEESSYLRVYLILTELQQVIQIKILNNDTCRSSSVQVVPLYRADAYYMSGCRRIIKFKWKTLLVSARGSTGASKDNEIAI